eukprot:CAMPEP_0176115130 /NCGR_PEP_ID=MMETSP0120_2-20121206/57817_1 /TAXON_ID=160619 /ORGANISM="Kryptoperidinium foliaceum, Strain CCMP 1326" /LENGTH=339 /DNA_ID=CAMNT_0017449367 /DNA_START=63 /DNA_END=1082 /DNA_ORIENTATION=-
MEGMAQDPAAAMKEISEQVQAKFDEAGMGKVEEFMDQMHDVMAKAKDGPGVLLESAQSQVEEIQKKLEAALADPSSVAGGAGCVASWYGGEVAKKLQSFSDETKGLVSTVQKMAADVKKPMKELAEGLQKSVQQLEGSAKSLAKLPKLIQQELEGKDSPDDIAQINTEPMKKALAVGDLDGPLSAIGGMKGLLDGAIAMLRNGVAALEEFLQTAPATVRSAFDLPAPLCALQSVLMSQVPQLLTDLLGMLEKLQGVSLQPLMDALTGTQGKVAGLDVAMIKTPVNAFMEPAKDLVDKLDKTVSGAKLASKSLAVPDVPAAPEVPAAMPKKKAFGCFGKK